MFLYKPSTVLFYVADDQRYIFSSYKSIDFPSNWHHNKSKKPIYYALYIYPIPYQKVLSTFVVQIQNIKLTLYQQQLSIKQMGNMQCCQDISLVKPGNIQQLEQQISRIHGNTQYYQNQWPTDQHITNKLNELKTHPDLSALFENKKVMKHKYLDKFYLGQWNINGFPEGKGIMVEPDCYIYYGQFHSSPHGKGVLQLFQERLIYEGQMKQGKGDGQGRIINLDHKFSFEGKLKKSFPYEGKLVINNPNDNTKSYFIIFQNFPEQKSKIKYEDGRTFEGFIHKTTLVPNGEGTATFPDGSEFNGNWEDGEMHGRGKFVWRDGSSYEGQYQHGRKHGQGKFIFVSKKYYEGQWANGKQNGEGILFDSQHCIQKKGIWKDGIFQKLSE